MKKKTKAKHRITRRSLWREHVKRAKQLRPFSVYTFYRGYAPEYDRALFAAAGRPSDASGYGGLRDHTWHCRTRKEATEIATKLVRIPGLEKVELIENVTELKEIEDVEDRVVRLARFKRRRRPIQRRKKKA